MVLAALLVAVVSALAAVAAVVYARRLDETARQAVAAARDSASAAARSAAASESQARLEAGRRHVEMTPRFKLTIKQAGPEGDDLLLLMFLAGPAELEGLDSLAVRVRDDLQGGVTAPYAFKPGTGPGGPGADVTGRVTPTSGMPVGESLSFFLSRTVPRTPAGRGGFWERALQGTVVRLQLECCRGEESWSLPCEVDTASLPASVEVP